MLLPALRPLASALSLLLAIAPLSAQQPVLSPPEVRRDSALAQQKIELAQSQIDAARFDQALASAREAERTLRQYVGENDPRCSEACALQGLVLFSTDRRDEGSDIWKTVSALPLPDEPASRARVSLFVGMGYLLKRPLSMADLTAAEAALEPARQHYEAQPGRPHSNLGRIYTFLGRIRHLQNRHDDGVVFYRKAISLFEKNYGKDFPSIARAGNNWSLICWEQGRYGEAIRLLQRAHTLDERYLPKGHSNIAAVLNNLGLVVYEKGDLDAAENYFLQTLGLVQDAKKPDTSVIAKVYSNLGMVCQRQLDFDGALYYFQQAIALERVLGDTAEIATSLYNIGGTYRDKGVPDTALARFEEGLRLISPDNFYRIYLLNGLGTAYEALRDYSKAEDNYRQAEQFARSMGADTLHHPFFFQHSYNMANVRKGQGRLPEALALNRRAQHQLGYEEDNPMLDVLLLFQLGDVLAQECQLLYQSALAEKAAPARAEAMRRALVSAEHSREAYKLFNSTHDSGSEQHSAKAAAFAATEIAIAAHCQLFSIDGDTAHWRAAFEYSEGTKSILLLEAMNNNKILSDSDLNDPLLRQERELRDSITEADTFLRGQLEQGFAPTDADIVQIRLQRSALYARHAESLRRTKERRFASSRDVRTLSVREVQASVLQPDQTLLEYFVGDSSAFIFVVKKGGFSVLPVSIGKDFPLPQLVDTMLRQGILPESESEPSIGPTEAEHNYARAAHRIYRAIWEPVRSQLTQRVVVSPDGALSYIPFYTLLTSRPGAEAEPKDFKYLLHDHIVSYSYSATLLHAMQQKRHEHAPSIPLLGFASFYFGDPSKLLVSTGTIGAGAGGDVRRDTLSEIKHSGEEVKAIAQNWRGKAYYGAHASQRRLRNEAPDARILLLSTHAKADDRSGKFSYLAFSLPGKPGSFEKLYARDLARFRLNADLVTLSACETGIGQFQRGEGMISLTQALTEAGAKSVAATLWSVKDWHTKEVTVRFYQNLNKGMPKDKALWQAQRDYLDKATNSTAHPYYWSGLIGIGDVRPLR